MSLMCYQVLWVPASAAEEPFKCEYCASCPLPGKSSACGVKGQTSPIGLDDQQSQERLPRLWNHRPAPQVPGPGEVIWGY